jgi:DNA polymerase-1
MASPVLLLDAFSLLYRAFFALPPLTTKAGEPTSGLYGLSVLLLKLLREQRPKGAAFALDLPRATFRHERYAGYKGTRTATPLALAHQVDRLPELTAAFGFPVFGVPGYEADDVLATLATELAAAGEMPVVVSGDRDTLQLAIPPTTVLYVGRGVKEQRYDEAAVIARFGVPPERLPGFIALTGDPSDNLPGVPGIGKRTAAALLTTYGSVAEILARVEEVKEPSVRAALVRLGAELRLWDDLARLRRDVPLAPGARFGAVAARARTAVAELFTQLEFTSLLGRLDAAFASADA